MLRIKDAIWLGVIAISVLIGGCAELQSELSLNAADRYDKEVTRLLQAGRYQEAIAACTAELDAVHEAKDACAKARGCYWYSDDESYHLNRIYSRRAWAKFKINDRAGAQKDLEWAVDNYHGNEAFTYYLLMLLYMDAGDEAKAMGIYTDLEKRHPGTAKVVEKMFAKLLKKSQ